MSVHAKLRKRLRTSASETPVHKLNTDKSREVLLTMQTQSETKCNIVKRLAIKRNVKKFSPIKFLEDAQRSTKAANTTATSTHQKSLKSKRTSLKSITCLGKPQNWGNACQFSRPRSEQPSSEHFWRHTIEDTRNFSPISCAN